MREKLKQWKAPHEGTNRNRLRTYEMSTYSIFEFSPEVLGTAEVKAFQKPEILATMTISMRGRYRERVLTNELLHVRRLSTNSRYLGMTIRCHHPTVSWKNKVKIYMENHNYYCHCSIFEPTRKL